MITMAFYLTGQLEKNHIDYLQAFSNKKLASVKEDTDAMLIADGYGNLIVPIPE